MAEEKGEEEEGGLWTGLARRYCDAQQLRPTATAGKLHGTAGVTHYHTCQDKNTTERPAGTMQTKLLVLAAGRCKVPTKDSGTGVGLGGVGGVVVRQ